MSTFDWIFYTNYYNDIKFAGLTTVDKALVHYKTHGSTENRKINLDVDAYLKSNDLAGRSLSCNIKNDSFHGLNHHFITYLLQIPNTFKVLEIGSGIGCLSLPIMRHLKDGHYTGIDTDKMCIDWAQKHIGSRCGNVKFSHVDNLLKLPFGDGEFDCVFSASTFVDLPPDHFIRCLHEAHRILKKGGTMVIGLFIEVPLHNLKKIRKMVRRGATGAPLESSTHIVNNYNESAILHQESRLYKAIESQNFKIKEIIFGHWSEMSNAGLFQDLIKISKIK